MVNIPSSMRTRALGHELVGLRKAAGYNGVEMARKLGWEGSRLSRIENGRYNTSEVDVTQYATLLGQSRPVLDNLLTMLRQSDDGFVVQPHGVRLHDQLHTFIRHETSSRIIHNFQLSVVPGLLQTKKYARALMTGSKFAVAEHIDGLVHARLARQAIFNRPLQPACVFYIHEFALRLPVGGNRTMNDQVMRLAFMANAHQVSIRIIPMERGAYPGIGAGGFTVMDHADEQRLPVVSVEFIGGTLFMDDHSSIGAHQEVLAEFDRIALDRRESQAWLVKLANEYDRPSGSSEVANLT
ncbi:MAG: helix-turn-helix transcriptional regulator [Umezawaea sp.]